MFWLTTARWIVFGICALSACIMIVGFALQRKNWNEKTRDYWYGRVMWSFAGMAAMVENVFRHTPFRYALIFIAAASLATLKGNLKKGPWGNEK